MHWVAAGLLSLAVCWSAQAAQYGRAASAFVKVYKDADSSSEVLVEVNKGQSIAVSNEPKNGWYKCLVPSVPGQPKSMEKFGWVQATDLVFQEKVPGLGEATPATATAPMKKYVPPTQAFKRFSLYGFYGVHFVQPSTFQQSVGVDEAMSIAGGAGGQFGVRFTPNFMISALFEGHSFSRDVVISADLSGKYYVEGAIAGGLAQYDFLESGNHRLGLAVGGGVSMATKAGATFGATTVESAEFSMPVYMGKLMYRWNVGKPYQQLGFVAEAGYRIMGQKALAISGGTVDLDMNAPTVAGGLQYEF